MSNIYKNNPLKNIRDRLGALERSPYEKTNNKTMKLWIYIIIFIFGVLLGWYLFSKPTRTIKITNTKIEYRDTVIHSVKLVPKLIYKTYTDTLWKTEYIDTNKIINDYFVSRGYSDTIVDDSLIFVKYTAVVNKNKLQGMVFDYRSKAHNTITTNTILPPINNIYVGGGLSGSKNTFGISGMIGYRHKRVLYIGSYDIINKTASIGALYQLK